MDQSHCLSVIIPVLDDADRLSVLLEDLDEQRGVELDVVVVDGGSGDDPGSVVEACGGRLVASEVGRGRQMNCGVEDADFDLLLFLHADSRLHNPWCIADAVVCWRRATPAGDRRTAGRFPLIFGDRDKDAPLRYRFLEAKTRVERPGVFNGDQGLMIHRQFFEQLGGFDDSRPFLEDQKIGEMIDDIGRWVIFDEPMETSARRFNKEGFGHRYGGMALIVAAHVSGLDEFFETVDERYAPQCDTEPVSLPEWTGQMLRLIAQMEPGRRRQVMRDIAALIVSNAWQIALWVDVAGDFDDAALQFFRVFVEPMVDNIDVDRLGAISGAVIGTVVGQWASLSDQS